MNRVLIQAIFANCQSGNAEALELLCEESMLQIRRQLQIAGIQYADVEDIAQDTMLRVLAKLEQVRDPKCYPVWLFRVTKSVYLSFYTAKKRDCIHCTAENIEEERAYMLPHGYIEKVDREQAIRLQISNLKKPLQEVLILKYINELSEEEISKKIKIPKGTVKSRLHYAKLRLQERC